MEFEIMTVLVLINSFASTYNLFDGGNDDLPWHIALRTNKNHKKTRGGQEKILFEDETDHKKYIKRPKIKDAVLQKQNDDYEKLLKTTTKTVNFHTVGENKVIQNFPKMNFSRSNGKNKHSTHNQEKFKPLVNYETDSKKELFEDITTTDDVHSDDKHSVIQNIPRIDLVPNNGKEKVIENTTLPADEKMTTKVDYPSITLPEKLEDTSLLDGMSDSKIFMCSEKCCFKLWVENTVAAELKLEKNNCICDFKCKVFGVINLVQEQLTSKLDEVLEENSTLFCLIISLIIMVIIVFFITAIFLIFKIINYITKSIYKNKISNINKM